MACDGSYITCNDSGRAPRRLNAVHVDEKLMLLATTGLISHCSAAVEEVWIGVWRWRDRDAGALAGGFHARLGERERGARRRP